MANQVYNIALKKLADGLLNFGTADIRVLFVKSGYVFNPDHDFVADLVPASNELTVAGYARQALGTQTTAVDDANDRATADAADPDFGALTAGETIDAAVYFVQVTNDADSWLLGYVDTGGFPLPTNGGNVKIQHGANGYAFILGA
jgi:hypothetical protein